MNTSILDSLLARTSSHRRLGQEEEEKEKKDKKPFPPKKDESEDDAPAVESDPAVEDAPSDGPGHKKPIDLEVTKTLGDDDVEDLPDPLKKGPGVIDEMLDSMPSHDGPGHEGPSHHDHKGPKSVSPFGAPGDTPLDEEDIHMLTQGLQQVLQSGGLDTERQTRVTKLLDALEGAPGKMTLVHDGGGDAPAKHPKDDLGADDALPALDGPPPSAGPKDKKPEDGMPAVSSILDHFLDRAARRRSAQMDKPMGGPSRMMPGPEDDRPPRGLRPPQPPAKPRSPNDQAMEYYRNFDRHETTKAGSR